MACRDEGGDGCAITLKWVFKLKRDEVGVIIKYNAGGNRLR
jgi:hypothetical protein